MYYIAVRTIETWIFMRKCVLYVLYCRLNYRNMNIYEKMCTLCHYCCLNYRNMNIYEKMCTLCTAVWTTEIWIFMRKCVLYLDLNYRNMNIYGALSIYLFLHFIRAIKLVSLNNYCKKIFQHKRFLWMEKLHSLKLYWRERINNKPPLDR